MLHWFYYQINEAGVWNGAGLQHLQVRLLQTWELSVHQPQHFQTKPRLCDALFKLNDSIKRAEQKKSSFARSLTVILLISLYIIINDATPAQFCLEFWTLFITSCLIFLSWLVTIHSKTPLDFYSHEHATWRLPIYLIQVPH